MPEYTPAELEAHNAARWQELEQRMQAEVTEIESRKGELPKRPQAELDAIKAEIEATRQERQTVKDSLVALRATKQATKDELQTQLAAATKAADKQAIRTQIDAVNAEIDKAVADLAEANATLDSLIAQRQEVLYQERLTKGTTTAEDEPRIKAEKDQQAADCAERKRWLAGRKQKIGGQIGGQAAL